MPTPAQAAPRRRLTWRSLHHAAAGLFGVLCAAIGLIWLASGKRAVIPDFPTTLAEAVVCTAGGIAVTIWAILRLKRECSGRSR